MKQGRSFFKSSHVLAIMACILWSSAFAGIKIGLKYTSPLQFAGIRFMIAGLLLLPFCRNLIHEFQLVVKNIKTVLTISLFQTVLLYTFFYLGLHKAPAAISAMVSGAGPLFVATLAHFSTGKDPMTWRKILALLVGFSGIVLLAVSKENGSTEHINTIIGIALLLVSNVAGSYGNILISKNKTGINPVLLNSVQIFTGGLTILILSFFVEGFHFGPKPATYFVALGWLSFLSAAAFSLWFTVLSRPEVRVSEINVWKFIIPVLGALLSWILIRAEKPTWYTIVGMILIAGAVLIIYGKKIKTRLTR